MNSPEISKHKSLAMSLPLPMSHFYRLLFIRCITSSFLSIFILIFSPFFSILFYHYFFYVLYCSSVIKQPYRYCVRVRPNWTGIHNWRLRVMSTIKAVNEMPVFKIPCVGWFNELSFQLSSYYHILFLLGGLVRQWISLHHDNIKIPTAHKYYTNDTF